MYLKYCIKEHGTWETGSRMACGASATLLRTCRLAAFTFCPPGRRTVTCRRGGGNLFMKKSNSQRVRETWNSEAAVPAESCHPAGCKPPEADQKTPSEERVKVSQRQFWACFSL